MSICLCRTSVWSGSALRWTHCLRRSTSSKSEVKISTRTFNQVANIETRGYVKDSWKPTISSNTEQISGMMGWKCRVNMLARNRIGLIKWNSANQQIRQLGSDSAAYDGDGKTTMRMLNSESDNLNIINTYSNRGFRLSNNLFLTGSILLFPTHVYSWSVKRGADINLDSLFVFDLIVPKVKIVIIGYGDHGEPYDSSIPMKLKSRGISCEMLPTPHAVTTYNFLVHDSVHVAGAFIPVKDEIHMSRRDIAGLYEDEEVFGEFKTQKWGGKGATVDKIKWYRERNKEMSTDVNKKTFEE